MIDVVTACVICLLGAIPAYLAISRHGPTERPLLGLSYAAHVVSAFVNVWLIVYYYGGGDMVHYARAGQALAKAMEYSPATVVPEVFKLLLHQNALLPVSVHGMGSSTGAMQAICALLIFVVGGGLYTCNAAFGTLSFFGTLAAYRAFRMTFPPYVRPRLLVGMMLIPSVVFWSSGLQKEAIAMTGLCYLVAALHGITEQRKKSSVLVALVAATTTALTKPYLLFAFAIAAGFLLYWKRHTARGGGIPSPVRLIFAGGLALGALVLLGQLFPRYAFDNLASEAASLQRTQGGGSDYTIGDPSTRTLAGQLAFVPYGLITALFRPFLFEVKNAQMLVNALETTTLTVLALRMVLQRKVHHVAQLVGQNRWLVFCVVYTLTLGVAVGLATTNLGTLSRYRMPLVPFFATVLLCVTAPVPKPRTESMRRVVPAQ